MVTIEWTAFSISDHFEIRLNNNTHKSFLSHYTPQHLAWSESWLVANHRWGGVPNATMPENFAKFQRRVPEIFDVKCFDILPQVAPLNRKPSSVILVTMWSKKYRLWGILPVGGAFVRNSAARLVCPVMLHRTAQAKFISCKRLARNSTFSREL